jgi:hypothetical protein
MTEIYPTPGRDRGNVHYFPTNRSLGTMPMNTRSLAPKCYEEVPPLSPTRHRLNQRTPSSVPIDIARNEIDNYIIENRRGSESVAKADDDDDDDDDDDKLLEI